MIATLSDPLALRLLSAVAGPRVHAAPSDTPPPADLLSALAETFGPAPHDSPRPTDAELARAALALVAEDPVTADHLEAMIEQGPPPVMGFESTLLAITAAIAVLQTQISFERTTTGKWKVKLHKKAASDTLLKGLAQIVMKALAQPPGDDGKGTPRLPE